MIKQLIQPRIAGEKRWENIFGHVDFDSPSVSRGASDKPGKQIMVGGKICAW